MVRLRLNGPQPFATILCKFADDAAEPEPLAYFDALLSGAGSELDRYWREVSYDQINLTGSRVAGWYMLPHPMQAYWAATTYGVDLELLAKTAPQQPVPVSPSLTSLASIRCSTT